MYQAILFRFGPCIKLWNRNPHQNLYAFFFSMGGALAIRACEAKLLPNVVALAVIDVVEGSAMSSLKMMHHFLKSRPQQFRSVEESIRWCVKSGTTRNLRAARISMPAQIKRVDKNDEKKVILKNVHVLPGFCPFSTAKIRKWVENGPWRFN